MGPGVAGPGRRRRRLGAVLLCQHATISAPHDERADRHARRQANRKIRGLFLVARPRLGSGHPMTGRDWSFAIWALLGLAVMVWLVATGLSGGRLPTLGAVVLRLTASRIGRVLLALGWAWLGWHAFAR